MLFLYVLEILKELKTCQCSVEGQWCKQEPGPLTSIKLCTFAVRLQHSEWEVPHGRCGSEVTTLGTDYFFYTCEHILYYMSIFVSWYKLFYYFNRR